MALISCPECSKEISDKASNCPNCGYPVAMSANPYLATIKGNVHDLSDIASMMIPYDVGNKIRAIKLLMSRTGIQLAEAKTFIETTNWENPNFTPVTSFPSSSLRCLKCSSTNIETISGLKKGASALAFGVFAANTVLSRYKCKQCGHKF